ncbi:MAG: Hsp70 family protein [Treponema sp.]|nr:Hsp70 family protein [Treponema sp.]
MKLLAGIDFGTSNSAVSYIKDGAVKMVQVEPGSDLIPTALFFFAETNRRLYGNEAIDAFISQTEGRFMRSIKSILGTSMMDAYTKVNKYNIDFKDIIRYFIAHLKLKLQEETEADEIMLVLGRPVKFHEDNEDLNRRGEALLREIAVLTGFSTVEFQYEPIAAAFQHEQNINEEKLAAVLDIGGGTSDFAIIRIGPQRKDRLDRKEDILACTGVRVGGNDFDRYLNFFNFMPHLGKDATITE